ncbi:MAG: glycoside hydrolase family 2 TIM barrel-domain containing protein [Bacteroidota bacterium]
MTGQTKSQDMNKEIPDTKKIIDLSGAWLMRDFTRGVGYQKEVYLPGMEPKDCLPCNVPGTVRTALLQAGEIPDPYIGYDNEKSLWVEQKEWWFFKKFPIDADLKGKFIDLVFEGASFQGEFWLNSKRIGDLKGMLNPRSFDVSGGLKYGRENSIAVRLEAPPDSWANTMARGLTWRTPRDQMYSIAQCMYGWDWGPHCVGIGLWQPIKLRITGPVRINNPYIRCQIPSAHQAVCNIEFDIQNVSDKSVVAQISGFITEKKSQRKAGEFKQSVNLNPGETRTLNFDVKVNDPKLWWPNGMGEQNLYILNTSVSENQKESDCKATQFGIRELKLVENENIEEFLKTMGNDLGDAHHLGNAAGSYPWTFQVNGIKMFAKGGNWIPVDQLLRLDRGRYDRLLRLFKDANFNLLRVWGGGLYETDDFYELCDEYGILAWQEFLSNRNFSKIDRVNFLDGAESAILRIRNHPSLTFWCGGNEFDPDDKGSKAVIDDLADLLKRRDPQREFHRASPYMGDDHYWGVWHQMEPYTKYHIVRPFRSEAGLNAPPVFENYIKFTPQNLLWPPDTTFIEYHGESSDRFNHLNKLFRYANEFGESCGIDEFITRGQLYQALGNEYDMEFCRSNKFRNSGFLVWQYNDIWPCLSWSLVDWYGTPKPSYYFLKRASRPIHISADYERYLWLTGETFKADIYLLNDTQSPLKDLTYLAKLISCEGRILAEKTGLVATGANCSAKISGIEYLIPDSLKGKTFFVSVELKDASGEKISDALYPIAVSGTGRIDYQNIFAELNKTPRVSLKAEPSNPVIVVGKNGTGTNTLRISNTANRPAFFIRIRMAEESDELRTLYDDNYISLMPGEIKIISVKLNSKDLDHLPQSIHFEVSGFNCAVQKINMTVGRNE